VAIVYVSISGVKKAGEVGQGREEWSIGFYVSPSFASVAKGTQQPRVKGSERFDINPRTSMYLCSSWEKFLLGS